MRTFLSILFTAFYIWSSGQPTNISGQVFDQKTNEPLPFVNITVNNTKSGTAADIDGKFSLNMGQPITSLTFSFVGYEKFSMPITANTPLPLQVYMREISEQLMEVEVVAGENPAHRIIRNAVKNRERNNPENLNSFSYSSYNKLLITVETDSLPLIDDEGMPDSSNIELQDFINRQHLFIMETASERKFKQPNKDTERIIANRVSGLKNPSFVLLANQLQSFTFYDDFITVLEEDYLNPVSGGSTRKYVFILRDSILSRSDTTFVVSFQPPPKHNFKAMKGLLYINSNTWAIQNVIAEPYEQESGFGIKIQQLYKQFEGGSWFPVQMNYDFKFYNVEANGIAPVGIGRTYLEDIKINPALERKDFEPVAIKIEKDAGKKDASFWDAYRKDSLDNRERETYRVIDSIGEAQNLDLKLKWAQAFVDGKIRWGILDFPLENMLRYNIYEGFRIGAAAETNENLLDWARVGGNIAYGFGDQVFKWGYFGELILNKRSNLRIGGGYQFDIYESGGDQWIDEPQKSILAGGNTRFLWIQQFDELSEAFGYVKWHPRPNIHTKVQLSRQNRFMPGEYGYKTLNDEGVEVWQNGFIAGLLQASVSWAPNDKYMEGEFGRRPIKSTYPIITAQFTQGVDGLFGGTLDFSRVDLKAREDFKTKELGITSIEVGVGKVIGEVPLSYLYSGRSNLPNNTDWNLYVADQFSFETMRNNEFLNDQYVQVFFRQNLQSRLLKIGSWAPDIEVMLRAMWGTLDQPDRHRGLDVEETRLGFYETGLELNKILSGLGVGAYYRFGPYQLPDQMDNWSVKMTYRLVLF